MTHYIIYSAVVMALTAVPQIVAQTPDFDRAVDEIVANNTSLSLRKAQFAADALGLKAENNTADPEVEFEHQWGVGNIGNKWSIAVNQSFDWPGLYRARKRVSQSYITANELLYRAEEADLRLKAGMVIADYTASMQSLELAKMIAGNLATIKEKTTEAYNRGQATYIDYRKAMFQAAEAQSSLASAQVNVQSYLEQLRSLNGGESVDVTGLDDFPQMALDAEADYLDRHINSSPAMLASLQKSEAARQNVSSATLASLPGFSLGYIHNVESGEHFNGLKVGITLPAFSNRHKKAKAIAEAEAAESEASEQAIEINRDVRSAYADALAMDARMKDYEQLFPSSLERDNYLSLLQKSYDGGQINLITYLYELNFYAEARLKYIELRHRRTIALLNLNRYR